MIFGIARPRGTARSASVAARDGSAEDRHHRVADELLDDPLNRSIVALTAR